MEEKLIREIDPSMVFKVHIGFVSITIKGKTWSYHYQNNE